MKNLILALLAIPLVSAAQSDAESTRILDEMSKVNSAYSSIVGEFDYELNNQAAGVKETKKGTITLSGKKFKIDLGDYIVNSDGNVVWIMMTDLEEAQIYDYEEFKADNDFDPSEIFNGYRNGFKTKFIEADKANGVAVNIVDLYPEDPASKSFSRIRLSVGNADKHLKKAEIQSKNGTEFTYSINSFKSNVDVSKTLKMFDEAALEAAGYTVDDLR